MSTPTEVTAAAPRRRFTAKETGRIVAAMAVRTMPTELGALLRGEGPYASYLGKRRQRAAAAACGRAGVRFTE